MVTTPVLIAAGVLTVFFFCVGLLNRWGEKHRAENPFLQQPHSESGTPK